jgi:hypothetical protein
VASVWFSTVAPGHTFDGQAIVTALADQLDAGVWSPVDSDLADFLVYSSTPGGSEVVFARSGSAGRELLGCWLDEQEEEEAGCGH